MNTSLHSKFIITKHQTNLLKGVGILLIVLHNYFHWVSPSIGENEFIFNAAYTKNLIGVLSNSFADSVHALFSFFGHYGVQLFVFISGYGLSKSFSHRKQRYLPFVRQRLIKLYPAFLIGIVVLLIYNGIVYAYVPNKTWLLQMLLKLAMVQNLFPRQALTIVGPWWFYSLILQLYLLFIPIYYVIKKYNWKGFLCVSITSYVLIYVLYRLLLDLDIFIMANAPGHIPEFALGILLALYPNVKIKKWVVPALLLVFVVGNFYFALFPFTFISITYLLVVVVLQLFKRETMLSRFIVFYGALSMFLFAIHGFFRKPYFVNTAEASANPFITIALGLLYLLTVTVIAYVCREVYVWSKRNLYKANDQ